MNVVPLTAETGRELGKGASRRLRVAGQIPATVYGMGSEPVSVTIERADLRRALTTDAGVNALIGLTVDGRTDYTLVKEIQRHPVRRDVLHVDFQRIDPEQPIALTVPVVLRGEPKQVTSNGGMLEQMVSALRVSVRPDSIPNNLLVDVSHLEIDQTLTVADIVLPDGVVTEIDADTPIVSAQLTRAAMMAQRAAAKAGEASGEAAAADGAPAADEPPAEADDAAEG